MQPQFRQVPPSSARSIMRDLGTQLRGAQRGDIAGGPTAEHHDALGHAVDRVL